MVGVCMTVLSLGRLADDKVFLLEHLVATASVAFLTSAICAYVSIRNGRGSRRAELIAEGCFLGGLVLLTVAGFFIAIELPG